MTVHEKLILDFSHGKIFTIRGSHDIKIFSVQMRGVSPVIYYLTDPNKDQEFKADVIQVHTGEEFNDILYSRHVGTVMIDEYLVLHYFARE
jgi:hypothetical protein